MFGKNAVAKARSAADGYLVHSIFYTIQGEGPHAGRPAIFVRFAGCNLRCTFCDTDFEHGKLLSRAKLEVEILAMARAHDCRFLVLTGGEPMLQPLTELIGGFDPYESLYFQIETAGTVWPDRFEDVLNRDLAELVCSPKTPHLHPKIEAGHGVTAWKYIIRATEAICPDDGLPYAQTQPLANTSVAPEFKPLFRPQNYKAPVHYGAGTTERAVAVYDDYEDGHAPIYVQPCDEQNETLNKANAKVTAAIAMQHGYRISIQLHKILDLD